MSCLLDIMTLDLKRRRELFISANNSTNLWGSIEAFCTKLGEFYGMLHKHGISYHGPTSEHCTLVDTTISGNILDIGGMTQDKSQSLQSMSYSAQCIKTRNLVFYLVKNILRLDTKIVNRALRVFWKTYKQYYTDSNVETISQLELRSNPEKIRTQYFDATKSCWIKLAADLNDVQLK